MPGLSLPQAVKKARFRDFWRRVVRTPNCRQSGVAGHLISVIFGFSIGANEKLREFFEFVYII